MADNDDKKLPAAKMEEDETNEDSDVELEGMDLDGLDDTAHDDDDDDDDAAAATRDDSPNHEKEDIEHEQEDLQELEAARKERMELMAEELKREKELQEKQKMEASSTTAAVEDPMSKFQYLIGQSEVFAHFLAGASAASAGKKKKKKGSRGKANRMTEAEEDAQLLATATSARRTVYLNAQPKILAEHCKMHKYQLEGLNWMIKLHDHGINGILADEVSYMIHNTMCLLLALQMHRIVYCLLSFSLFLSNFLCMCTQPILTRNYRWAWERHSKQSPS